MNAEHSLSSARPAATAQVISLGDLHPEANRHVPAAPLVQDANPLHSVRARLQVCAGQVELSVGELLCAREAQVFVLDRAIDEPVDLLLEGKVVARGQLVAVDGKFALRIVELPVALRP